jgi:NAD(P)-dependent dehydrogenase (short-subunit alcohol dehydrogenase family)
VSQLGPPSILVHNAGVASSGRTVVDTDPAELVRVVSVHAFGAFYLAKYALPFMISAQTGDVIFISSGASEVRAPNAAPYCMGKVALDCLASVLAKEVQRYNIRVNVVAPGLVASDMGDRLVQAWSGGEATKAHEWDARYPFGRVCRPEDVANTVAMLLAVPDSYISGAWIRVDGGGRVD